MDDASRTILGILLVLGALLGTVAPPAAQADEEVVPEETALLACDGGRIAIEIPAGWRTNEDPAGWWAEAHDPEDAALRVRLSRHPLTEEETLEGFRSRHLAQERSAAFEGAGSWFEERREAGTLVARPLADPPLLSLYVHVIRDGEGQVFEADVPLRALSEHYDRLRRTCFDFRELRPTGRPAADGWPRRFTHEIPEEISFLGHPFLQVVEAATEKGTFGLDEAAAWERAMDAWAETKRHAARLAEDPAYRAADGAFANIAFDPRWACDHRAFRWVQPYAFVALSKHEGPDVERAPFDEKALVFTQIYRHFLARFGESLKLGDLMAAGGGGPLQPPSRSFPEGAPLVVRFLLGTEEDWYEDVQVFGRPARDKEPHGFLDRHSGTLDILVPDVGTDATPLPVVDAAPIDAEMAAHQLLWWFSRQMNRWGHTGWSEDAITYGTAAWLGGVRPSSSSGRLDPTGINVRLLANMRAFGAQFEEVRRTPYPFFPLATLLAFEGQNAVMRWCQSEWGVPGQVGWQLFQQQAWAFVCFLDQAGDGARRELLAALLAARLRREMAFGQSVPVARRILGLEGEAPWKALDEEFQAWVREELWALDLEAERRVADGPGGDTRPEAFLAVHWAGASPEGSRRLEWAYTPYGRTWTREEASFSDADTVSADVALVNLLRRLSDLPGIRGEGAASRIEVVLVAPPPLGWNLVQEAADLCIATGVDPAAIHAPNPASSLAFEGPDELPAAGALEVVLQGAEEGTSVVIPGPLGELRSPALAEALTARLKAHLDALATSGGPPTDARVTVRPAEGAFPSVGDMQAVARALRAAGIHRIVVVSPTRPALEGEETLGAYEVVVRLSRKGDIVIVDPITETEVGPLPLVSGTSDEQAEALRALRTVLARVVAAAPREDDGSSTARILVHGDRRARWQYVQWIMQMAADPAIQIYKIQFAVRAD